MPNERFKGLLAAALMMGAMAESGHVMPVKSGDLYREPSYKRKKCKSCKYMRSHRHYFCEKGKCVSPTHEACIEYQPKKKKK